MWVLSVSLLSDEKKERIYFSPISWVLSSCCLQRVSEKPLGRTDSQKTNLHAALNLISSADLPGVALQNAFRKETLCGTNGGLLLTCFVSSEHGLLQYPKRSLILQPACSENNI
jgi:hypothetical protein